MTLRDLMIAVAAICLSLTIAGSYPDFILLAILLFGATIGACFGRLAYGRPRFRDIYLGGLLTLASAFLLLIAVVLIAFQR